ncbi:MAG: starch synthase [Omnitrophica WOR_2 bacterium GWF2_43_52]|nr:MAG: starch synthase [Omnitrophica WOR_2 bacterium GWC2_44_8]OGX21747.1 MAG: starch synthase [Omnitrophica WOR_2 bacterium GWF2_43_52]HAH21894.1 glycogen synthase GlgA [Candidatus Omnitrophota bacterium]HBG64036.1 glycogen synthase GlgA [Candidatus Omnitrophota bacterium]
MKVLFCASEVFPFAKTGGLADVAGALPVALEKQGVEVRIVLPKYKTVTPQKSRVTGAKGDIEIVTIGKDIQVYLIKNDAYFNREGLYGNSHGDYPDNLERFSFYCRRALEVLKEVLWQPDIIHCHDWQAALVPLYLKYRYPTDTFYKNIKTLFTIHNLAYQGVFDKAEYKALGLRESLFSIEGLEFYQKINLLKGGLIFSDLLTTVSPSYAEEIQTKRHGCGLEGVLAKRKKELLGILNGLDYEYWNPKSDTFIYKHYSEETLEQKYDNKRLLQEECGLAVNGDIPLFGIVGRLAQQKGWDLLAQSLDSFIKHTHIQIVILGEGEHRYEKLLHDLARKYPHAVSVHTIFNEPLAHKIYAGSDMFLMPSHYEPCGLGQMIALRYGTVPIVFKTGGLADTVSEENGFVFEHATAKDFVETLKRSIAVYQDKKRWRALVKKAFTYNFSWDISAKKYIALYEALLSGR